MVEARAELVPVESLAPDGAKVLRSSRQVRQWDLDQQRHSHGIQAPVWNLIIQKCLALPAGNIGRIENRGKAGKVALPHRSRGNRKRLRQRLPDPLSLIAQKEKSSIFLQWTTDGPAELVLAERRDGRRRRVEEVLGVEHVIANKLE